MDSLKIFSILNKIESQLDLSKFNILGIDIWPHLRTQLVERLNKVIIKGDPSSHNYFYRVYKKIELLPKAIINLVKLSTAKKEISNDKKDIVFLTDSSAKRMKMDDRWYDSFIDPIIDHYEQANLTYHTFESSQRFLFRYPGLRTSQPIILEMIQYYLRSLFFARKIRFNREFLGAYSSYRDIMDEIGLDDHVIGLRDLRLEVSYIYQLTLFFQHELERIKPRLVFMVPYCGYLGTAMTYVCNKLSIVSIDIQHGVQGAYHPAYSSFTNLSGKAYNTLPKVFLTWSETERNNINKWAAKTDSIRAIVLGNLYEKIFLSDNTYSLHFDRLFRTTFNIYKNKLFVLISLIWDQYLPLEFKKLLLDSPEQYFYLIRFHPSTTNRERKIVERELKKLGTNNYELACASQLPLYSVLRNVRFNIRQRSSTVIDATHFGVISIITDKIGRAYYQEYITDNKAFYCDLDNDILTQLSNLITNSKQVVKSFEPLYQPLDSNSVLSDLLEIAKYEELNPEADVKVST